MRMYRMFGPIIITLLFLSACSIIGAQSPTPTSEPPIGSTPTAELVAPTAAQVAAAVPSPTGQEIDTLSERPYGGLLARVKGRGTLLCGVNGELPGFSIPDPNLPGSYTGFDADFCRVIATAIFGDAEAVTFVPLSADERFRAAVDGTVDVLIRNTTWTAARDVGEQDSQLGKIRLDFGPTIFHDGQRFMIRNDLKSEAGGAVLRVADLAGKAICVIEDTTSELNLRDEMRAQKIPHFPIAKANAEAAFDAYEDQECDAITSDTSQLVGRRTLLKDPDEHRILPEPISREPLGPVFIENDSEWRDVVSWAIFATIYAEELGVTKEMFSNFVESSNANIRRLLGEEDTIGEDLGLANDFAANIIRQVGNYAEIYERNLGDSTPYALDRGPNKAWNKGEGGVLSSPPFR